MTEQTKRNVNALIGLEREHQPEHPDRDYPVDDPWKWGEWNSAMRFRWAALAALEAGDTAEAAVLASLATAAEIGHVGLELSLRADEQS